MNLITPKLKDSILRDFVISEDVPIDIEYDEFASKYSTSSDRLCMILEQFEAMNLIKLTPCIGSCFIQVTAYAHYYISHGGFTAQEEILKANIEKLGLELETLSKQLEPNLLDKAEKIVSLGSNILNALNLFL
ncbi:hypothetical protein [Bacteroides faecalis]|uniref:Uncharacterized protein n=1 Tax=Bacteroides faecalis TaxID=2447885 RepID=A0A401LQV2_9BACE|nr:hypothetical protein [Bacteroides faecalis]GCB33938.1 hypothetical protein KGMB02408_08830 [Bacteroides faecalis]